MSMKGIFDDPVPEAGMWRDFFRVLADEAETMEEFEKAAQMQRGNFECLIAGAQARLAHRLRAKYAEER